MKHPRESLQAYLDGELQDAEREVVGGHLAGCRRCREELATLRAASTAVAERLAVLEPPAAAVPAPTEALARFRSTARTQVASETMTRPTLWDVVQRSFAAVRQTMMSPRWRPALVGLTAIVVLAIVFSFAPVRHVAADFLGLFRVRKFAVIPIDPAQAQRLNDLASQAETMIGDPEVLRPEGAAFTVADAAQASSLAGFGVRAPAELPEGARLTKFEIQAGPALRFEVERSVLETLLRAAGVEGAPLPQTDTIRIDLDLPTAAHQEYQLGAGKFELIQMPSPEIDLPEGIDPLALSELAFRFLGMPDQDAARLARSIDWSSTVVIPLPTDMGQSREVSVDGVTGLFMQSTRPGRPNSMVLWERDGILYGLNAENMEPKQVLDFADSLH